MHKPMLESQLWVKVKRSFPGLIQRVESLVSLGLPDCYYARGWLELKVLHRVHPIKPNEAPDWGLSGPQAAWHHRWTDAGGTSHILAAHHTNGNCDAYYLIEGKHAVDAFMGKPVPHHGMIGRLDWSFFDHLVNQRLAA